MYELNIEMLGCQIQVAIKAMWLRMNAPSQKRSKEKTPMNTMLDTLEYGFSK